MGLATDLSYAIPGSTALHRGVRAVASTRQGAWTLARVLPALDRLVARLTHGRTTLVEQLAGLPVLVVTTTGRRTGLPRPAQLVGIPVDDEIALLGTNFGQSGTPTWVLNLEADPRATVTHRGATAEVVARPATDAERTRILALAGRVYVGYPKYLRRVTDRRVRVLVLERAVAAGR
ncbi:nitroreductase family deazaflavin-dependent oxidoreductase [Oryzobacter terrae]|uniref:nitroreductase family deazaflavin-dependent oxidoreductase n=1 Tax=Oryzobacter terrae TaxID=1620385 RepID=UPI00366E221E